MIQLMTGVLDLAQDKSKENQFNGYRNPYRKSPGQSISVIVESGILETGSDLYEDI